jgi:hypothetical protein
MAKQKQRKSSSIIKINPMKKTITTAALICSALILSAQIPNASFENWTSGEANSWQSDNFSTYISVTQSNQAHAGNSAVKLGVVNAAGNNTGGAIQTAYGTSTTQEGDSLSGWYKSNLLNGDQFVVSISMYSAGNMVATSINFFPVSQSSYTRFAVAATQYIVAPVDSIILELLVDNISTPPDINSYAIVDELHLGSSASGIHEQQQAENLSVFPNPFSSHVNFTATEKSTVELYSMDGKLLLSEDVNPGNVELNLSDFPEGIYMMVLKNEKQLFRQEIVHRQ